MFELRQLGIDPAYILNIVLALTAFTGFAALFYRCGRRAGNIEDKERIQTLTQSNGSLSDQVVEFEDRFDKLETVVGNPQDFWSRKADPPFDPLVHQGQISSSIPILTVINFKGGVGKTTICANLAGYFARQGKKVLLIDFDYQGSLTDTVLSHARIEEFIYTSHQLLQSGHDPEKLRNTAERLSSLDSNLWMFPAFYGFSKAEIQMMFRWLVGKDKEVRYNLHDYLQSPNFQKGSASGFDIVLIDAPPRMLTGSVNALAASTHVLVPTILDGQSHIATLNTLGAIQTFRQKLNKNLKTIGVVPSMVATSKGYNEREKRFIEELERQIPTFHQDGPLPILTKRPIVRKEELARAGGNEVLYLSDRTDRAADEIRAMFAKLGAYISDQLDWKETEAPQVIAKPGQVVSGAIYEDQKATAGH